MLKGIPSILTPDLFRAMHSMGHGESIAIVDGFYPAETDAAHSPLITITAPVLEIMEAITDYFPLDEPDSTGQPVTLIAPPAPEEIVIQEVLLTLLALQYGPGFSWDALQKPEFREATRQARHVVRSTEKVYWGCIILRKGVLPEEPAA